MFKLVLLLTLCSLISGYSHTKEAIQRYYMQNQPVVPSVVPYVEAHANFVHYGIRNQSGPFALVPHTGAAAPVVRDCGPTSQERVRQCADPLYKVGALTEDGQIGNISWKHFLTRTKEYFNEVCDNFFVFDLCIEPYKDVCFDSPTARFRYDTALKVLDFVCRDGYAEMMSNFDCFTKTLTRAEMMQCQAEMVADTRKIPVSDKIAQNTAACGAMRNYVDCVRYPVRYECGYRAWQLVREMIVRPTEALLPGCYLDSSNSLSFIVILVSYVLLVL